MLHRSKAHQCSAFISCDVACSGKSLLNYLLGSPRLIKISERPVMTQESRPASVKLRFNAAIERVQPGFQIMGPRFQWYATISGRCGFTIEERDYIPPGTPPLPEGSDTAYEFTPNGLVSFGLSFALALSRSDIIKEYFNELDLRLNKHRKANILVVEDLYGFERDLWRKYPSMADWGIPGEVFCRANVFQSMLQLDGKDDVYLTLRMKRKYFVSWMRTLEDSLAAQQSPELIIHFKSSFKNEENSEQAANVKMHQHLEKLLNGETALAGHGYSMRGFLLSSYHSKSE